MKLKHFVKLLTNITGKRVHINILEIKRADLDAKLVAKTSLVN